MPLLPSGPPQGKVAPSRTTHPATSLKDPCPPCKPTQGQRAARGHVLGRVEREEKRFVVSQWGKQAGGRLPLWKLRGAPQNPTLKQRGPPNAPSKWRGPRLPLAGLPLPKHGDSPAGQERQLNAVKIGSLHVLRTRAAARVWRAQPEEGGRGGGGVATLAAVGPPALHAHCTLLAVQARPSCHQATKACPRGI